MRLFNSSMEMQLRILLLLSECKEPLTLDKIVCLDFIIIYGAEFGVSDENLHGDNRYKYSELPSRRDLVQYSLRELVINNFIIPDFSNGFRYQISENGLQYILSLDSTYAEKYTITARKAIELYSKQKDHLLLKMIQDRSFISLKEGGNVLY